MDNFYQRNYLQLDEFVSLVGVHSGVESKGFR
jgi:hypothetical protein